MRLVNELEIKFKKCTKEKDFGYVGVELSADTDDDRMESFIPVLRYEDYCHIIGQIVDFEYPMSTHKGM